MIHHGSPSRSFSLPSPIVLGLALFSMFFGSGNLIFPLFLGQVARGDWLYAFMGFSITAVFLPLLGVLAVVSYGGHYKRFFDPMGSLGTSCFLSILLCVWIPLGSAPRCIALSYASLSTYFSMGPLWLYSLLYSLAILLMTMERRRMFKILGSWLTPLLLLCLFGLWVSTLYNGSTAPPYEGGDLLLLKGILEGYNTMDLIASFFFSASIVNMLFGHQTRENENDNRWRELSLLAKAGWLAAGCLTFVYGALLYAAACHGEALAMIPKEQMLAHLAKLLLGEKLGVLSAVIVLLACVTTSVALLMVFAEFLAEQLLGTHRYFFGLLLTSLASYTMALTGLEGITAITAPLLNLCYPFLLVLILLAMARRTWRTYIPIGEPTT